MLSMRLPKHRYTHKWDIYLVTKYLDRLGKTQVLLLKLLSFTLAMLFVLPCAERASFLAKLDLRHCRADPEFHFNYTGIIGLTVSGSLSFCSCDLWTSQHQRSFTHAFCCYFCSSWIQDHFVKKNIASTFAIDQYEGFHDKNNTSFRQFILNVFINKVLQCLFEIN